MALDPRIALAGQMPPFSLMDWGQVYGRGQQLQAGQMALTEEQRQLAEAEAIRQAYRQQYGGGTPPAGPAGLAGAAPMRPGGAEAPVQERQLGGGPPSAAFPYATPPPSGPQAPQGLAGLAGLVGQREPAGGGPGVAGAPGGVGQDQAFINQLYTISPKAGREAEAHAYASQELQFKQHLERVEYLGRIAEGVLDADTQAAYDVGRQMLIQAGMPPGQMPPIYDRNLMRMYAGVARDSQDKLRMAQAHVAMSKEQRERNLQATQAPDYGYKDLNPFLYERYGSQLAPGQPPSPEMVRQAQADKLAQDEEAERRKKLGQETGKLEAEKPAEARRVQAQLSQLERGWQTVDEDVDQALEILAKNPALRQTGIWGKGILPGTPAYHLRQLLKTIQANVGFDKLQQMREASPTGGALGQVSDKENELLAATAGSLDPKQSADQLERNLRRIKGDVAALRTEKRRAFEQQFGTTAPTSGRAPVNQPGAGGRSPYAGRAVDSLTPEQAREELEWMEQHYN